MKKLLSVLVAIAMCACLCLPAFAAEDILSGLGDSLGDLDLENFDVDSIKDGLSGLTSGLGDGSGALDGIKDTLGGLLGESTSEETGDGIADTSGALDGIKDTLGGLLGESTSEETGDGIADTSGALDGIKDTLGGLLDGSSGESGIGEFDPTGALTSFVESLDISQITELFSGLTDALGSLGISLPTGDEASEGSFDISSILGGNSGDGAGVASIMDTFGGVLESLGLDSSIIEALGQSDIVNFFANLYMGSVPSPDPEPETEPTTEAPTTTQPHNPTMGVNDGAAVVAACATLSVAAAALFVCTRKKHA
ncbi:MAG: hypothetical protein ACI4F5_07900 [Acutalibacteraceae bacterium]